MFYVTEVEYYDTQAEEIRTEYYGTDAFSTAAADTPANRDVAGVISNPALIRRDVFDVGTTGGEGRIGFGELVLRNEHGAMYVWQNRAVDGRLFVVRVSDDLRAPYPSAWHTLYTGTMSEIEIGQLEARIRLRDRQVFASLEFQPVKYLGDNVGPVGLEGGVELAGKPKPRVIGAVFNIEPVAVNPAKLVFQADDQGLRDIPAVYDAGGLLTPGADYADATEMMTVQPARGGYRKWKAGGMFRLGSTPEGLITCDAIKGLTPLTRAGGNALKQTLIDANVDPAQINDADIARLVLANPATVGLYYRDETTNAAVIGDICRTLGAWWAGNNTGLIGTRRLEAPVAPAVLQFDDRNTTEGTLKLTPLEGNGLPVWRVIVRGVPNYTVQTSGLLGSVLSARRARLAQPYQDAERSNAAVKVAYLLAPELTVETKFSCLLSVQLEAQRLLDLYSVKRERYELEVFGNAAFLAQIDLGITCRLMSGEYNLQAGKLVIILGYQLDPTRGTASLTVWG